jgi:hypothetical protein
MPCAGYLRTIKVNNGFFVFEKKKGAGIAYCSVLAKKMLCVS